MTICNEHENSESEYSDDSEGNMKVILICVFETAGCVSLLISRAGASGQAGQAMA